MSKQILDTPFENELPVSLGKGETILWRGQTKEAYLPTQKEAQDSSEVPIDYVKHPLFLLGFSIFMLAVIIFFWSGGVKSVAMILGVLLFWLDFPFVVNFLLGKENKQVEFLVTQKRVIIYPLKNKKKPIHIINMDSISNISISKKGQLGTIIFQVKNQPTTDVVFRKFEDGENRTYVRLENIERGEEVLEYLKKANSK